MPVINILHIIKSLGRGGAEMLLPETLKVHDKDRFRFHYVYFLPWKDQMVESIEQNDGIVRCFVSGNNVGLMLQARRVARYARENNITIIHAHLPWAGFLARVVHLLTGIPVIYTEHNKQERYHGITRLLNRMSFNWQTHAVAVSADVAASIRKNISVTIPVQEIHNGVNTEFFARDGSTGEALRNDRGIPPDAVVVGIVSVFRTQKRLAEWLTVFEQSARANPQLYGIIVGDGPLRKEIEHHRAQLGLEQRVIMPGLQKNVKPWLNAMDVFMMSSLFEGLPVALLEAMSMECAVVTTDAGGIREVVDHGHTGLVVPVDEWPRLSDALNNVVADERLRARLAKAARTRITAHFGMEKMVQHLEALYLQVNGKGK